MNKNTTPALQTEAFYSKSQAYISKGLRAKSQNELEEYQLWASMALELLAKSSLSRIHPALVADPTHYQSLFAACGVSVSPDIKTITAKTLFLRLSHISKSFDSRVKEFCEQLALRRNSEVHSGESPFSGMKADAWEKKYWHAIEVILSMQKKDLDEWLGAEHSKAPKNILQDAERAVQLAVETRISHKKEDFEKEHKSKKKRDELIEKSKSIRYWDYWKKFDYSVDGYELNDCPSCSAKGILGGLLWHEEISDEYDEDDPYKEYVEKTYSAEEFLCPTCDLRLSGTRELAVTNLPEEFSETEEREREFEPDYGND